MSQPNSAENDRPEVVQKQQLNVYTVMLIVAFCAITMACLLLYLELRRWGPFPWWKAEPGGGATSYIHQTIEPQLPQPQLKPLTRTVWI